MSEVVLYDGLQAALEHVLKNLPDEFAFEVDGWRFRNLDMGPALALRNTMLTFEKVLHAKGYAIKHSFAPNDRYLYELKRAKPAAPEAIPAQSDGVIDV